MRKLPPFPIPVLNVLNKLGHDIRAARIRRRITASVMADRVFITRMTYSKVEKGDPSVSMGIYATVIFHIRDGRTTKRFIGYTF